MLLIGEPRREEGRSAKRRGRPVQRSLRHRFGARDRGDGLGQLPAAGGSGDPGLLPKIRCEFDPEIEAEFPANMSGKLTVRARGTTFVQRSSYPRENPTNFLTEAELRAKFAGLTDSVLGAEHAARLADAVLAIDTTADVAKLMRLAAPLMPARLAGD